MWVICTLMRQYMRRKSSNYQYPRIMCFRGFYGLVYYEPSFRIHLRTYYSCILHCLSISILLFSRLFFHTSVLPSFVSSAPFHFLFNFLFRFLFLFLFLSLFFSLFSLLFFPFILTILWLFHLLRVNTQYSFLHL